MYWYSVKLSPNIQIFEQDSIDISVTTKAE